MSDEPDPLDDDADVGDEKRGFVPDFVRRMAWAGIGAVFMSEEGIRRLAGQLKLPKEALSFLLHQAEKTKDEIGKTVSEEVRKLLQSDRLRDELLRMIAGMTIEVRAEVKLVPDRVKGEAASLLPKIKVGDLKTSYDGRKRKKGEEPEEDLKNRPGKLLVMAAVLGGGLLLWRTGVFGLFPTDRTLVWRLPVSYGEVRKLELQVWGGEELLKREEFTYEAGLVGEPSLKLPLSSGPHRAIATVWLLHASSAVGFQHEFDPKGDETVVIELKKP